jgi:hypothetical protein
VTNDEEESTAVTQLIVWEVAETAGFETAWISTNGLALHAAGHAAGQLPEPYWVDYRLAVDGEGVTASLDVCVKTAQLTRELALRNDRGWTVDGRPRPDLAGAIDCDLAWSPVTNSPPIRRSGLHTSQGSADFTMAFVELPGLRVRAAKQSYEHQGIEAAGARVRYRSGSFVSDLLVDDDGLVIDYPTMARRVRPARFTPGAGQSARPR